MSERHGLTEVLRRKDKVSKDKDEKIKTGEWKEDYFISVRKRRKLYESVRR